MGIRETNLRAAICLAASLVVAGCTPAGRGGSRDDDKDGKKDDDKMPLTVDRFLSSLVDGYCTLISECGGETVDDCRAGAEREMGFLRKGVEDGRMKFVSAAGQACLDRLSELTCEDGEAGGEACDFELFFQGTVKPGDECYDSLECEADSFCAGDELLCPGHCTARIPVGGDCSSAGDQCVPGAECNDDDRCEAYAKKGEPCGVGCESSLYCQRSAEHPDGICAEPGGIGAPCETSTSSCQFGLYCRSSDKTCQAYIPQGGRCDVDGYDCANGLRCQPDGQDSQDGTCQPYKAKGESCAPGSNECRFPFWCSSTTNTCAAPGGVGDPCGYIDGQWVTCAEGFCSYTTHKCEPAKKEGEACDKWVDECERGLDCGDSGKCEPRPVCQLP